MDLRIFLSSTVEDLRDVRKNVLKLLSVIPADLVSMETFGSDESQPLTYCLEKVRKSNLFVGIYAERYGSIDSVHNLSVTELEYNEASKMLENGELFGLLVYVIDRRASWPVDQIDRDPVRVTALEKFKQELKKKHVVTMFKDPESLPLDVLRDILRKIGVGTGQIFRAKGGQHVMSVGRVGALGMEHYTERDAASFRGRETEISAALDLIGTSPLSLLIGDSGIGKTSLIQAGVFPALRARGWSVGWCRPLEDPDRSMPSALWHQFMEGPAPQVSIGTTLQLIAGAQSGRNLLVVIDQFEDIIPALGSPKTTRLLSALSDTHNTATPNLHVVVCYRGDAEPKVGSFWQQISGSPSGLPRYYLGALSEAGARTALGVALYSQFPGAGESDFQSLVDRMLSDVAAESVINMGVSLYPPFLQMALEGLIKASEQGGKQPTLESYVKLGGARHFIGRYLYDQLLRMGSHAKECRSILANLASNQKRQRKSSEEISTQTGVNQGLVDLCLLQLQSLRLVHVLEDQWEIVHDFLSQKISEELVAPEEREARLLRDVLSAKSSAYETTGELLTFKEHLGIYSHRGRIHCSPLELEALFISHLHGNGPIEYFLQGVDPDVPAAWAQRSVGDLTLPRAQAACRYLMRNGRFVPFFDLAKAFSGYKMQSELSDYIYQCATQDDVVILLKLRSHKAPLVRAAAGQALLRFANSEDNELTQKLLRRGDFALLCRLFIDASDPRKVPEYRRELEARGLLTRVHGACGLASYGKPSDLASVEAALQSQDSSASGRHAYAFSLACRAIKQRQQGKLLRLLALGDSVLLGTLDALRETPGILPAAKLLRFYDQSPEDVANVVAVASTPRDASTLRGFLKKHRNRLSAKMTGIALGLVRVGTSSDVRFLLDLIAAADEKVPFWGLQIFASEMKERADTALKSWLLELAQSPEFWEYMSDRPSNTLPVKDTENLYMFKRLSGVVLSALCGKEDWQILKRLLFHPYWSTKMAAANSVSQFVTTAELDELIAEARNRAANTPDEGVISSLNLLDQKRYWRPSPRLGSSLTLGNWLTHD